MYSETHQNPLYIKIPLYRICPLIPNLLFPINPLWTGIPFLVTSNILSGPEVVWLRGVKIHYFWNLDTCFHYIVFIIFKFNTSFQVIYFIEFNEKEAYGHYGNYISGNVHLCVKILHNLQNITKLLSLLDSLVVECWHRVREVLGSIPSQGPRHTKDIIKMVPVIPLFSIQQWKGKILALSQELR